MEEGSFAKVSDMGLEVEMGIHFNAEVGDNWREGEVVSGEGDAGYGGVLNLVWGADLDDFCFGAIELKKIESHPRLDLLQAGGEGGERWW